MSNVRSFFMDQLKPFQILFHGPCSRNRFRDPGFRLRHGSHCHYPLLYCYCHESQYQNWYYIFCFSFCKNSDAAVILYWFWTLVGICWSWRTVHCFDFDFVRLKLLIGLDSPPWQLAVWTESFHFSFSLTFSV